MSSPGSVTYWVERLRAGDADAASRLWHRYFTQLVALARTRLAGIPLGTDDEEDVALSALDHFCRDAADGAFPDLEDRDDLWRILAALAVRGVIDRRRRDRARKRDAGRVAEADLAEVPDRGPAPDMAVLMAEEVGVLLERLGDPELQTLAVWKLEGHTNDEIAARRGCVPRTVERRLRVIRSIWTAHEH